MLPPKSTKRFIFPFVARPIKYQIPGHVLAAKPKDLKTIHPLPVNLFHFLKSFLYTQYYKIAGDATTVVLDRVKNGFASIALYPEHKKELSSFLKRSLAKKLVCLS